VNAVQFAEAVQGVGLLGGDGHPMIGGLPGPCCLLLLVRVVTFSEASKRAAVTRRRASCVRRVDARPPASR
jgi:hypothetical protein